MRVIARLPDERQVGALVDSLKNSGIDRKDMIISNLGKEQEYTDVQEATEAGISLIKTENDSLNELIPFSKGMKGLKGETGIIVAVEAPKRDVDRIRTIMEQSGAVEIIQD